MYKKIIALAIPSMLINISQPLLSSVDVVLASLESTELIAGIGLATSIFNFLLWNFAYLKTSVIGLSAKEFGKDNSEYNDVLNHSVLLGFICSVLVFFLSSYIFNFFESFFHISSELLPLVKSYYDIRIPFIFISLASFILLGFFFGTQKVRLALNVVVLTNILNMLMSYYLVVYEQLGIRGIAWGTVFAETIGFLCLVFLARKIILQSFLKLIIKKEFLIKILSLNSFILLRNLCLSFVLNSFVSLASQAGVIVLAAYVLISQLINWASYSLDGVASSVEALVGESFGKKSKHELREVILKSFHVSFIMSVFLSLIFFIFDKFILSFFTDDLNVISIVLEHKVLLCFFPIIAFSSYIWDGVYIGLTASFEMFLTMLLSCLVVIGSYYFLAPNLSIQDILLLQVMFVLSRAFFQRLFYKRMEKKILF